MAQYLILKYVHSSWHEHIHTVYTKEKQSVDNRLNTQQLNI